MSGSVSFDRAAEYYDGTRAMAPEAGRAVTELLSEELSGRGRVLEIGVGTGRIALPLHEAGTRITGIDLSLPMMDVLRSKGEGRAPLPLALADATGLPFADDSFGGAVVCHVFHLIPQWTEAAAELIRVVRPGGRVCVDWGHDAWDPLHERLADEAGIPKRFRGANSTDEIDEEFERRGATTRVLPVIRDTGRFTRSEMIDRFASGQWSWTWAADAATLREAAERTRVWATAEFGDLDETTEQVLITSWRVYDMPGAASDRERRRSAP